MRILTIALLALQAATAAQQKRVEWVPNPRPSGGWVADPSHHLKPATIDSLNAMASALERETSDEIAIVIVDSTKGLAPADFALALHRAWGVGKGTRDNGVVVLWVPPQRDLYVSVGYGLEGRLIDGRVGRIRDEQFFPAFRANQFDRGMLDGVRALIAAAREEGVPIDRIKQPAERPGREKPSAGRVFTIVGSVIAAVLAFLGLFVGIGALRHRRLHHCPKCHARMRYISRPRRARAAPRPGPANRRTVRQRPSRLLGLPEVCDPRLRRPHPSERRRRVPEMQLPNGAENHARGSSRDDPS